MITFISTVLVFSLVVLIHEFGHFQTARSVGIKIEEFAIGMGPVLFKKTKKGVVYSVRLLPIGGFVRMEGEDEDVESPTSFNSKTVWQRFKVIAAGPIMNYVLAIVIFIIISVSVGVLGVRIDQMDKASEFYKAGIRPNDKIVSINNDKVYILDEVVYKLLDELSETKEPFTVKVNRDGEVLSYDVNQYTRSIVGILPLDDKTDTTLIATTDKKAPSYIAGLRDGDKIVSINDTKVNNFEEVREAINSSNQSENGINITVERDGTTKEYNVVPQKEVQLGFNTKTEKSFTTTIVSSFYKTGYYVKLMFNFIGNLFTGRLKEGSVGGPVQVVSMIGETSKLGIFPLLNLTALLSINLGFFNLLPIPALDGSKLVFLIIEKIRGKKIPVEKEGFVHLIGFVVLIGIMLFVTYKDIVRLF